MIQPIKYIHYIMLVSMIMQNILSGTGFRSSNILRRGVLSANRLARCFAAVAKQDGEKLATFTQLGLKDDLVNALAGQS